MLIRNLIAEHVYLACGRTDMRKSIDGLAALALSKFQLDPHQSALFLFCSQRKKRIKGLLWGETGFLLLYKHLENGRYQWPDTPEDLLEISEQQLRWLTESLSILQPQAVQKVNLCKSVDSSARVSTDFTGFCWYNGWSKNQGAFRERHS